jgi:2-oxoisovalerate dehydrogenase E2 component (dihydrolipoyl transacylase)
MGATFVVKLPDIGEGIVEAELVGWRVQVGDAVREDQIIAEVMTDKATVEIPAPCAGTVTALGGEVGERLVVGSELLRLEALGGRQAAEPPASAPEPAGPVHSAAAAPKAAEPSPPPPGAEPATPEGPAPPPTSRAPQRPVACSPAVRRRARDLGVDLRDIAGTGPEGRILHADLDAVLLRGSRTPIKGDEVQEVPVVGLRRRIAERMADSARRVAHFSYVEEVDVTALEELRATLNAEPGRADRPRLTPLPFLALAVVRAITAFPQMNAHYDDEANVIRRMRAVHLGIATQTANGLMVPVLRHAEGMELWDCASGIARIAQAARDGSAKREELGGSTITITSLGALGGLASTPIVNAPEVAIIGTNRIATRPVWHEGVGVVPRRMMNLSSSFDHRVVDGHDAAVFVRRIKMLLETPALLFVERA